MHRNGSGYYDPTAYKEIKNIEREENEMEVRKGEVWQVEMGNSLRTAVVLAVHGSYSTVLTFSDEQRERRTVQINAQGMKYTEPGMITYKFHDAFDKFIRLTTDEEFADIMNRVSDALEIEKNTPLEEIPFAIVESKAVEELQKELKEEREKNAFLEEKRLTLLDEVRKTQNKYCDTVKITIERDLYKQQYESLLERVIAKAV